MKYFIMTDLEGPALISRFDQTRDVTPEGKRPAMQLLTGEVNACVEGILDADPKAEIVVWDGHGSGGLEAQALHPRAKVILRGPIRPPYYLDASYDALLFVGQHAMKSAGSVLCHSYSSKTIAAIRMNGTEMGEFGCRALLAGTMGIPTIFIAGDNVAVAEAEALVPGIISAAVKESLGEEMALHLSHPAACELVRRRAAEACRQAKTISPYVFPGPYTQEIQMLPGVSIEAFLTRGYEKIDDSTVSKSVENICDLLV